MSIRGLGRRAILKGIGASPLAAHAVGEQMKLAAAGLGAGVSGLAGAPIGSAIGEAVPVGGGGALTFTSFADWLGKIGDAGLRRDAQNVSTIDPDLVEMRLPLVTKVRMQRERNYRRLLDERRRWFDERLSLEGVVKWWP